MTISKLLSVCLALSVVACGATVQDPQGPVVVVSRSGQTLSVEVDDPNATVEFLGGFETSNTVVPGPMDVLPVGVGVWSRPQPTRYELQVEAVGSFTVWPVAQAVQVFSVLVNGERALVTISEE